MEYFGVPKGLKDIRLVFSASDCGLNPLVLAPSFWMPYSPTMVCLLSFGSKVVDIDLGENFLNDPPLERQVPPYTSVDLTPFREELKADLPQLTNLLLSSRIMVVWERTFFGFPPSPYVAIMPSYKPVTWF